MGKKKKEEEKVPRLVPLVGCLGCGLQVAGCGGVHEASPPPPPCVYRDRGTASSFAGTLKVHLPFRVDPLAIEVFDYVSDPKAKDEVKQVVKIEGRPCNVFLGQKGRLRPYGCNTLFASAGGRLKLNELLELPKPTLAK